MEEVKIEELETDELGIVADGIDEEEQDKVYDEYIKNLQEESDENGD